MQNILKLSRKFVLLAMMLFGLSFVIFTDVASNSAGAMQCCSDCIMAESDCWIEMPGPERDECFRIAQICFRWCYPGC